MKNAAFVLVIALFAVVFAGCLMGTPDLDILTGECPSAGDSRVCGNTCSQGTQLCSAERNPDGTRVSPESLVWSVCEGAVECVVADSGTPVADSGPVSDLGVEIDSGIETDASVVTDAGIETDSGPIEVDAGPPDSGPIDAGRAELDAGPVDAALEMDTPGGDGDTVCYDGMVRGCSNACSIPSLAGVQVCDPAVGYGECVPIGMSCAADPPSALDCPAVGIAASVVIACITPCRHIGWQTLFDYCEDDACRFLRPETCDLPDAGPPATDMGTDLGPSPVVDAGAGTDAGTDAGPPDLGPPDLGPPDLGPVDAGPPDGGPVDAGPPDMGPVDAGPPDLGPTDAGVSSTDLVVALSAAVQATCSGGFVTRSWDTTFNPAIGDVDRWDSTPGAALRVAASEYSGPGAVNNTAICFTADPARMFYGLTAAERLLLLGHRFSSYDVGGTVRFRGADITDRTFFCFDTAYSEQQIALGRTDKSLWDANFVRFQFDTTVVRTGCMPGTGP